MKHFVFLLIVIPSFAVADPYTLLHLQAVSGRHDLPDSDSLMLDIGIGYKVHGIFIEWDAGINAEVPFQDVFTIEDNQQKLQMAINTGYLMELASEHFLKLGVGSRAAMFDENCYEYAGNTYCERREEYGPTYRIGYFFKPDSKLYIGIELSSDELSDKRKYGAVSFSLNTGY